MSSEKEPYSPLALSALVDLCFRPARYFARLSATGHGYAYFLALLLHGMTNSIDKINLYYLEAGGSLSWAQEGLKFVPVLNSWPAFWGVVCISGLVSGVVHWLISGWWYKARLELSGVEEPSAMLARRVWVAHWLVFAIPVTVIAGAQTVLFPNYWEAWHAIKYSSVIIGVLMAWSCWTSYVGAISAFPVSKSKAMFWFFTVPMLSYLAFLGFFYYGLLA